MVKLSFICFLFYLIRVDSDHIVNGNIKMILGLLWQFILRYQIVGADDKSVKIALKKLLLIWLQHVIPERKITNLTRDWNDGIALCNLINVLQPGLCPEYHNLDKGNSIGNVTKGRSRDELIMFINDNLTSVCIQRCFNCLYNANNAEVIAYER